MAVLSEGHRNAAIEAMESLAKRGDDLLALAGDEERQKDRAAVDDLMLSHGVGAVLDIVRVVGHGLLAVATK